MTAQITVEELPHFGKYDGDILFDKDAGKGGALALSVIAKGIVVWPIFVIIAGIYYSHEALRVAGRWSGPSY